MADNNEALIDKSFIASIENNCKKLGDCHYYKKLKDEEFCLEKNKLTEIVYINDNIRLQKKYETNDIDEEGTIREQGIFLEIVKGGQFIM